MNSHRHFRLRCENITIVRPMVLLAEPSDTFGMRCSVGQVPPNAVRNDAR